MSRVTGDEAKVSYIWILGEFGDSVPSAPYILERFIDQFDEQSHSVKMELLTASCKLFFSRAPEMHGMLGRLFEYATSKNEDGFTVDMDVFDRAHLYYSLLQAGVNKVDIVLCYVHISLHCKILSFLSFMNIFISTCDDFLLLIPSN